MTQTDVSASELDPEIDLLDLLETLTEHLRLLLLGPMLMALLAWGVAWLVPPTYSAKTVFLPPQQAQSTAASMLASLGSLGSVAGVAGGLKNPLDQYAAYLKSRAIQDQLIDEFDLMVRYKVRQREDARGVLAQQVRITTGKDGLITVEVQAPTPQWAAELANAHVQALQHLLSRLAVTEAQQRRLFFEKQLQRSKQDLLQAEQALKRTGVSDGVLKSSPVSAVAGVSVLRAQITAQEIKIGAMRGYLAETAPDFRQALTELASLRQQLSKLEKDQSPQTISQEGDYMGRFREFKYHETLFELFAKQYELARVDEAREGAVVQILDPAEPPERPSKPQKFLIAAVVGLATGLLLLIGVFVRQAWRKAQNEPGNAARWARISHLWWRAWGRR